MAYYVTSKVIKGGAYMKFDTNYPIYLQIVNEIKRKIIIGEIKPGSKLPSNSDLAGLYKINPNTVQRIYKQLEFEGISYTKRGLGTYLIDEPDLAEKLMKNAIDETVSSFLEKMSALGLSPSQSIEIIKNTK